MYNTIADVQEKNDAITNAQKKNDASCKCTIPLRMYMKRNDAVIDAHNKNDASFKFMMQLQMYTKRMLKNKLQKGAVKLKYVPTKEQVANVLTKPLDHVKFEYFLDMLGVV